MATADEATDTISLLVRSQTRLHILRELCEHEQLDKHELRARIDASRTTVQRNVESLDEQGLIEATNSTYTINPCGTLVAEELFELIETTRLALKLQPVFNWLEATDIDFDLQLLTDAEIVFAEPHDPYAPVHRHIDALETADRFRGVMARCGREAMKTAARCLEAENVRHEVVVGADAIDILQTTDGYADVVEQLADNNRCQTFVYDGSIPYYLGILDETVQLGVEDDNGVPRALIEAENAELRDWAETTYHEYKDAADRLY